jgi:vitamin B12 transporter
MKLPYLYQVEDHMSKLILPPIALTLVAIYSIPALAETSAVQTTPQKPERMNINITKGYTTIVTNKEDRTTTGTSITIIDEEDLKKTQAKTVAEILKAVPGVSVSSNGGMGSGTGVYIRGGRSTDLVVIIDGVKVNDPSSVGAGFDFSHLMTENIEYIEVIRGSQSALYGSDAMSGVIKITTKKGKQGFHPNASIEAGSRNYQKTIVSLNGATKKANYNLSVSRIETDGIDNISDPMSEPDDDSYRNQNVSLTSGYKFNRIFSLDGIINYTDAKSEYDTANSYTPYDPLKNNNVYSEYTNRFVKINSHLNLLDNHWNNRLSFSYTDTKNKSFDPQNTPYTLNEGNSVKAELQSDYLFIFNAFDNRFTFASESEKSKFKPWNGSGAPKEEEITNYSIIGEYGVNWLEKIYFTASLRHDFNSDYDDTTTYKVSLSAWASATVRLHANHGTGVKNPTFAQIYGNPAWSIIPNLNLKAETSTSWDAGLEYNFKEIDGYIDFTYFINQYEDRIDYISLPSFQSQYQNIEGTSTTQGIELSSEISITQDFSINANYTFVEAKDKDKKDLHRRPKQSANINANYQFTTKFSGNLGLNYVGESLDHNWESGSPVLVTMDDYIIANIAGLYQVNKHFSINGRVENALNQDYEAIYGYNTDPISFYLGVSFK